MLTLKLKFCTITNWIVINIKSYIFKIQSFWSNKLLIVEFEFNSIHHIWLVFAKIDNLLVI